MEDIKLSFAACRDRERATTFYLGADTHGGGFSESLRGQLTGERADRSPAFVRKADRRSPSLSENLLDGDQLYDIGDLDLHGKDPDQQVATTSQALSEILAQEKRFIVQGGDHLLKHAALKAVSENFQDCGVLYFDAHPDCEQKKLCYSSILHHAWQLPNIGPERTSIVAVRQMNVAERAGVHYWKPGIVYASEFARSPIEVVAAKVLSQLGSARRVYVSIDLDGLNPSEAPAVEAPYPGGPFLRELLAVMAMVSEKVPLIGMDITEFLPKYDHSHITALACARLAKEFYAVVNRDVTD